jgi:hypothetical protein
MHVHHLVPKHSTYFAYLGDVKEDPYYKAYLTVDGHACQHDILFRVFGQEGDRIARDTLSGQITRQEAISQARADWIKKNPGHHSRAGKKGAQVRAKMTALSKELGRRWGEKTGRLPWWNNGIINRRSPKCPGPGFIKGRLPLWGGKRDQPTSTCPYCAQVMSKANLSRHIAARH